MISEHSLGLALERGVLTADQIAQLRAIEAGPNAVTAIDDDDEKLRFVSGFGDLFVTIGLALFLGSAAYFVAASATPAAAWATVAGLSWLLAEFFTRRRRMALPSIVLLLVFTVSAFAALTELLALVMPDSRPAWYLPRPWYLLDTRGSAAGIAALLTAALAGLHYWRFRVPITIAAGAAALCTALIAFVAVWTDGLSETIFRSLTLVCGLAVFVLAMRFDMSDPLRITRRTDIAFWLHLLAAPLIVHSLVAGVATAGSAAETSVAIETLMIFFGLGIVAVVIDRRAMLVSGLLYAAIAFTKLVAHSGFADRSVPAALLVLGAFVLLLSAGWRPLRRLILRLLPPRLAHRLPNPLVSTS